MPDIEQTPKLAYIAEVDVRWSDQDSNGHVNNSVYLTYFEQARILWWRHMDSAIRSANSGPVVASASCRYLKPIQHPAILQIKIFIDSVGRSSVANSYEIRDKNQPEILYAQGSTVLVWIDYVSGKPISLPVNLREKLSQPFNGNN